MTQNSALDAGVDNSSWDDISSFYSLDFHLNTDGFLKDDSRLLHLGPYSHGFDLHLY